MVVARRTVWPTGARAWPPRGCRWPSLGPRHGVLACAQGDHARLGSVFLHAPSLSTAFLCHRTTRSAAPPTPSPATRPRLAPA
jgi:hypothetical protein